MLFHRSQVMDTEKLFRSDLENRSEEKHASFAPQGFRKSWGANAAELFSPHAVYSNYQSDCFNLVLSTASKASVTVTPFLMFHCTISRHPNRALPRQARVFHNY